MSPKPTAEGFDVVGALLSAYAANDRINAYLIENLDDAAWNAPTVDGKGRTISAIVAHIHNVRLMWLRSSGASAELPEKLNGDTFSRKDAIQALAASCTAMHDVLSRSLAADGRIKGFKPDAATFLGYLFAHDAHHRGQIAMIARQVGHPLPKSVSFGLWEWGSR